MQLFGIHTRLIEPGDDIVDVILDGLRRQKVAVENQDVLVVASKVVATVQRRLVKLSSIEPSKRARELSAKHDLEPSFVEVALQEAEKVYGGVSRALLEFRRNAQSQHH